MNLVLERKGQANETPIMDRFMMTPPINEDYWAYRVRLTGDQAIIGFPKFFTVGIGFAVEEDWNTNLPYTSPAEEILAHIKHNKGDDTISDENCLRAIKMIQGAILDDIAM